MKKLTLNRETLRLVSGEAASRKEDEQGTGWVLRHSTPLQCPIMPETDSTCG